MVMFVLDPSPVPSPDRGGESEPSPPSPPSGTGDSHVQPQEGAGGRGLNLSTVNGEIRLKKGM